MELTLRYSIGRGKKEGGEGGRGRREGEGFRLEIITFFCSPTINSFITTTAEWTSENSL